jgi:hypothetical protein
MWDNIADLNRVFKQYDRLNHFNDLNKAVQQIAPHLAMPSKEISAFYDSIKGLEPPALLEMKNYVSELKTFSEFVNPFKSILDNNILIKSNIDQLIKDISPFSSSLSILSQLSFSYCETIFKQKEAFMQIPYLRSYQKKYLLRHEHNQQEALIVDRDDFENTDTIAFNVVNTISFINSLAALDNHDTENINIADNIEHELDETLKSHGRGYLEVLEGAKQAANSDNPDKVRHTVTSLRELSTRILHDLAPDEQIKKWSNKKEDYANGRPTRKCRVAYIFRNLAHSKADSLIENEIKFITDFFSFFNRGTHELMATLSAEELKYLIYKSESTLLLLLRYSLKE